MLEGWDATSFPDRQSEVVSCASLLTEIDIGQIVGFCGQGCSKLAGRQWHMRLFRTLEAGVVGVFLFPLVLYFCL